MAGPPAGVMEAWDKVTGFLHSQVNDEANRAFNSKVAKAVGQFAGSILLMHKYGDVMAV